MIVDVSPYIKQANEYLDQRKYDEALALFNKVIEIYPHTLEFYSYKADAFIEIGDYQQAIEVYNKYIDTHPLEVEPYVYRIEVYIFTSEYEKALADAEQVIHLIPENSLGYKLRYTIQIASGQVKIPNFHKERLKSYLTILKYYLITSCFIFIFASLINPINIIIVIKGLLSIGLLILMLVCYSEIVHFLTRP